MTKCNAAVVQLVAGRNDRGRVFLESFRFLAESMLNEARTHNLP